MIPIKKFEKTVMDTVAVITGKMVEKRSNKWPPDCMGILYQPKRPKKKNM